MKTKHTASQVRPTFENWLLAQVLRSGDVGNLARIARDRGGWPKRTTLEGHFNHLAGLMEASRVPRHEWTRWEAMLLSCWAEYRWFEEFMNTKPLTETYRIAPDGKSITCLLCERTSHNPMDVSEKYCGYCKEFHLVRDLQVRLIGGRPTLRAKVEEIPLRSVVRLANGRMGSLVYQAAKREYLAICPTQEPDRDDWVPVFRGELLEVVKTPAALARDFLVTHDPITTALPFADMRGYRALYVPSELYLFWIRTEEGTELVRFIDQVRVLAIGGDGGIWFQIPEGDVPALVERVAALPFSNEELPKVVWRGNPALPLENGR